MNTNRNVMITRVLCAVSGVGVAVNFIDRRFYRRKYDAHKALAEFVAVASRETDLTQLTARLTGTVQEALQPEQITLWLKARQRSESK